jgi:hypothetical protein
VAAPATHIVLADKVFNDYFAKKDKKKFFIGTSFPDIRYLGAIDRDKTHFRLSNVQDISKSDSFEAGIKFHSLVDNVGLDFMSRRKLYSYFPESEFQLQAVKIFEDGVLYSKLDNWSLIRNFFEDVVDEEKKFGVASKDIERWHDLLRNYLSEPFDSNKVIFKFVEDIGEPKEMAYEMIRVISEVSDRKKAIEIIEDFYSQFDTLIAG